LVAQHSRRRFLSLAAGATALPALSNTARAQTYPTRPVRIIVGVAPGEPEFEAKVDKAKSRAEDSTTSAPRQCRQPSFDIQQSPFTHMLRR
jgi:phosphodiesterase/alkaline phosphatase D-like protein